MMHYILDHLKGEDISKLKMTANQLSDSPLRDIC